MISSTPCPMPIVSNITLARRLRAIGASLKLADANPYRIRAYYRAADLLDSLQEAIETIAARGELEALPGIGKDLARKITEYLATGQLTADPPQLPPLPPDVQWWTTLPGLSKAMVQHLYFRLKITTPAALATLARAKLLQILPDFTSTETALLAALTPHLHPAALSSTDPGPPQPPPTVGGPP